jgi:hypothetical protein
MLYLGFYSRSLPKPLPVSLFFIYTVIFPPCRFDNLSAFYLFLLISSIHNHYLHYYTRQPIKLHQGARHGLTIMRIFSKTFYPHNNPMFLFEPFFLCYLMTPFYHLHVSLCVSRKSYIFSPETVVSICNISSCDFFPNTYVLYWKDARP